MKWDMMGSDASDEQYERAMLARKHRAEVEAFNKLSKAAKFATINACLDRLEAEPPVIRGMDEDWGEPPAWLREVRANGAKVQGRVAR